MALTLSVIPGTTYPDGTPVDRAELRLGANPTMSLTGTVEEADIGTGAVTPTKMGAGAFIVATDSGTAAAYVGASSGVAQPALVDGLWVWLLPANSNTGAATFDLDGLGAKPITGPDGSPLEPSAIVANTPALLAYHSVLDKWVLCSAGSALNQVPPKGIATLADVSVTAPYAVRVVADSVILTNPATGVYHRAYDVDETANVTTLGAGGLDTGSEANTKYYVYLVSDGTDTVAMLSTSSSAPSTANFAWTSKVRIGAVLNNASGDFSDTWCDWPTPRYVSDWTDGGTTYAAVDFSHNLGRRPRVVRAELKLAVAGAVGYTGGYTVGDILDGSTVQAEASNWGSATVAPMIPAGMETTTVRVLLAPQVTAAVRDPSLAGGLTTIQMTDISVPTYHWQYRVICET